MLELIASGRSGGVSLEYLDTLSLSVSIDAMQLDRNWIASHIPHQEAMCLIDQVMEWTDKDILCRTASHRLKSNPLRTAGSLRSECGIEYGAQAIAIHRVLNAARQAPHRLQECSSVREE